MTTIGHPLAEQAYLVDEAPLAQTGARHWQQRYSLGLGIADAIAVALAVLAAQELRFGQTTASYTVISVAIAAGWILALTAFRTRAANILFSGTEEYRRLLTATMTTFCGVAVLSSALQFDIARGYLAIALPVGIVVLVLNRRLARRFVARRRSRGLYVNRVLAVGHTSSVAEFRTALDRNVEYGYQLVESWTPDEVRHCLRARPIEPVTRGEAPPSALARMVQSCGADTVALVSGDLSAEEIRDLSWELGTQDIELVISPRMADVSAPRLTFRADGGLPIIHVGKPLYQGAKRFEKRLFDVVFSSLVLIVAALPMLLVALAIKLDSRGPVFYMAERIGIDGKPFRMFKFRSMVVGADSAVAALNHLNEGGGVLFKIREDPRVTRLGRLLRRFSIDELPQFLNVLRGEMSVVGPRPPLRTEVDQYDNRVRRRLLVRPGVTGLWQISGRSDLSWEESVRLDISYVENWSMINDLVITVGTLRAVLRRTGAY